MNTPIVTTRSGVFNFLGLPPELRNRIYRLHLSKEGSVDYQVFGTERCFQQTCNEPISKPVLGVNVLRVCKQIYLEAVRFAYADRIWDLGRAASRPDWRTADCAERLTRIHHGAIGKVQRLQLEVIIEVQASISCITTVAMGDLTKLKSLESLNLFVMLENRYDLVPGSRRRRGATFRYAPLLIGLVCQIMSQVPAQVKIAWISDLGEMKDRQEEQLNADLEHIAHRFGAIQGCNCATST